MKQKHVTSAACRNGAAPREIVTTNVVDPVCLNAFAKVGAALRRIFMLGDDDFCIIQESEERDIKKMTDGDKIFINFELIVPAAPTNTCVSGTVSMVNVGKIPEPKIENIEFNEAI